MNVQKERADRRKNTWHGATKADHSAKFKELQEAINQVPSSNRGSLVDDKRRDSSASVKSTALEQAFNPMLHGYSPVAMNDEEDTDAISPREKIPADLGRGEEDQEGVSELDMAAHIERVVRELRVSWPDDSKDTLRVSSGVIWAPRETANLRESQAWNLPVIRFGTLTERLITRVLQLLALLDLIYVPFILAFAEVYPVHHWHEVWRTDTVLTTLYFILAVPVRLRTSIVCSRTRDEITDPVVLRRRLFGMSSLWGDTVTVIFAPLIYADLVARMIGHRYLRRTFKLELSYVYHVALQLRWLGCLRILKIWRLKSSADRTMLLGTSHISEEVAKIVTSIFLAAHVFGCVWFWAKTQSPEGWGHEWTAFNGWAENALNVTKVDYSSVSIPILDDNLPELTMDYFRAFKDGIYMLAGWGGPDSTSEIELTLSCMLGPLSSVVSGLILAKLMQVSEQQNCLEIVYANKMATINAACDGMELPQDLRGRINRYHSYMSFHQMDQSSQDMLFSGLSVNLLAEVKLHCMRDVIAGTSFFEGLTPRLISFLVVSFEEATFSPCDVIVRKNEIGDIMYIIMRGRVGIYLEEDASEPVTYKYPGNYFGEISLVFPMPRTAWIRAVHYVVLMQLNKERFDYILEECPQEKNTLLSRIVQDFRHLVPDLEKLGGDMGDDAFELIQKEMTKAQVQQDQRRRTSLRASVTEDQERRNSLSMGMVPSAPSSIPLQFGSAEGSQQNSARMVSPKPVVRKDEEDLQRNNSVNFAECHAEEKYRVQESADLGNWSPVTGSQDINSFAGLSRLPSSNMLASLDEEGSLQGDEAQDNTKIVQAMQKYAGKTRRQSVASLAQIGTRARAGSRGRQSIAFTGKASFDEDDEMMCRSMGPAGSWSKRSGPAELRLECKLDELLQRVTKIESMLDEVHSRQNEMPFQTRHDSHYQEKVQASAGTESSTRLDGWRKPAARNLSALGRSVGH